MQITGNTMLVTGGGSGIGLRLAEEFAKLGNEVIIAGRDERKLRAAAARPKLHFYALDVADPDAIHRAAVELPQRYPALNVIVNNAGIMVAEDIPSSGSDLSVAESTIATNLLGPIRMVAAFLPHLRRKQQSAVINVSSGLAFVPLVRTPTYCATKAAIHSYTLTLRQQLAGTGTEVLELIPPAVQTDLMPGHATDPHAMPLADYIAEAIALFKRQPTPSEICVARVGMLRNAEAEGRFQAAFDRLNPRPQAAG